MAESALSDLTVVDLGQGIAGPYCSKLFAALGAEVVKVEPPEGDPSRRLGPFPGDVPHPERSGAYLYLNMGKKGVTLNLRAATGRELFLELVAGADVLIESFLPSVMPSLGLGYDALHALNPRLVVVSITPFGQYGPYRDYRASDIGIHAISGEMYVAGEPDREPLKKGASLMSQYHGGLNAYLGAVMALFARDDTGEGQQVDVSLAECVTANLGGFIKQAAYTGKSPVRKGNTSFSRDWPPGYVPCKDGYLRSGVRGTDWWPDLKRALGLPELEDERFATTESRAKHVNELNDLFIGWLMQHDKKEVFHIMQKQRLPYGYVATAPDILESPQLEHRQFLVEVNHPAAGAYRYPTGPFKATEPLWRDAPAPLLGEHNEEVFCGRLGLAKGDLVALRQAGVV